MSSQTDHNNECNGQTRRLTVFSIPTDTHTQGIHSDFSTGPHSLWVCLLLIMKRTEYFEELQVLTEVVLVHCACVHDKTDLFHLPVLSLYHVTHGTSEGCALVLNSSFGSCKTTH